MLLARRDPVRLSIILVIMELDRIKEEWPRSLPKTQDDPAT
jgi:hypothetical protein